MANLINTITSVTDMLKNLKTDNVKDVLVMAGLFYTAKVGIKILFGVCSALKTYGLTKIWPRNFIKEYGSWASKYDLSKYM